MQPVETDALGGARWSCAWTEPDSVSSPAGLVSPTLDWLPVAVPGTAAGALRDAGVWSWGHEDEALLDGRDWWFRCDFTADGHAGPWDLTLGGVATLSDVWLDGQHLAHGENMFASQRIALAQLDGDHQLVIRCAALTPRLAQRHPRPRFKSRLVRHQSLRWYRTTLLGRMPGWSRWAAPVGPWRPVTLIARPPEGIPSAMTLEARCLADGGGEVALDLRLTGASRPPVEAWLCVGEARARLQLTTAGDGAVQAVGAVTIDEVERWWPHTHGAQPLYAVELELDGNRRLLRRVGFRVMAVDRADDGFSLHVNGEPVFARGATWGPLDAVSLTADAAAMSAALQRARAAGLNLIRIGGFGIYEDQRFWDLCDELGLMVWQDAMIASVDPPDDDAFLTSLRGELREQFGALQGRPSLAVACGSSESYQQGSMLGLEPQRYRSDVLEHVIAEIVEATVPGTPYVPSSPSGGDPPIRADVGVTHYFGVGAYLRPVSDARLAGVRFAAECLSFANPPERATVEEVFGSATAVGHDPRWKLAVARDAGTSWDFEDVRDHYVAQLFGVDPLAVRYRDPEHALDLGRAAIVQIIGEVFGDWRPATSGCSGAIMLAWGDLWPGAGWGINDARGRPKASYYALARACRPVTLLLRDRGLNGLAVDVYNDAPEPLQATLRLSLHGHAGAVLETAERPIAVAGHGQCSLDAAGLLGGFRDLTEAYRFSSSAYDAIGAELIAPDGKQLSRAVYLPGGCARPRHHDVGLSARAEAAGDGVWRLTLHAERLATFVSIDAPGLTASDSWLHLLPREPVIVTLHGDGPVGGTVRALNASASAQIVDAAR